MSATARPAAPVTHPPDERGRFVFVGIPPGAYQLTSVQSIVDGGSPSLTWASQPVTIADADITGLSIAMQPGTRISGRIVLDSAASSKVDLSQAFVSMRPATAGPRSPWNGWRRMNATRPPAVVPATL